MVWGQFGVRHRAEHDHSIPSARMELQDGTSLGTLPRHDEPQVAPLGRQGLERADGDPESLARVQAVDEEEASPRREGSRLGVGEQPHVGPIWDDPDPVGEILLFRVAAHVVEGQHGDGRLLLLRCCRGG